MNKFHADETSYLHPARPLPSPPPNLFRSLLDAAGWETKTPITRFFYETVNFFKVFTIT